MAQPGTLELAGPATPAAPTIGAPVGPGGTNQTITLAVENMTCGGCMRKVEKALLEVPGVASARSNLSARRATVVFEEAQPTAAPLVDALGRVGFKAAELAPEALDSGQDTGRQLLSRLAVPVSPPPTSCCFRCRCGPARRIPAIPSMPCFIGFP